jgi:hypothetical protein
LDIGKESGFVGGTTNNFYRIAVPVNIQGPVRFAIKRTASNGSDGVDYRNFIILDNIIASPPPMRAWLAPCGTNDLTKVGKQVLGYAGAFTKPFPSTTDKIFARAKLGFYTNNVEASAQPENFVTSAKMHYRWRYLDQKANPKFGQEWNTVD